MFFFLKKYKKKIITNLSHRQISSYKNVTDRSLNFQTPLRYIFTTDRSLNFQTPLRYIFTTNRSLKIQIPIVGGMRKNLCCAAPILLFLSFFFIFYRNKLTLTNALSSNPQNVSLWPNDRKKGRKNYGKFFLYFFFVFLFLIGNLFSFLSFNLFSSLFDVWNFF